MLQTQIVMFGSDQIQHDSSLPCQRVWLIKSLLRSGDRVQQGSDESHVENFSWGEKTQIQCIEEPAYIQGTQEGLRLSCVAAFLLHHREFGW